LAEAAVDEFAALALAGDHPIELSIDGGPRVLGDEQRVLQIVRALVENALAHTAPGTQVRVRVGGGALMVEDAGPGVPAEHAERVFERFYRAEGRLTSGSGLGLAIARELATAMGGSLELESEPGRTRFTLRLPVAAAEETEAAR
jgi:two-component system, OmpR family, sensor kinase